MPKFGTSSQRRLDTCHPDLKMVFKQVVLDFDCSILCGYRGEEEQNRLADSGMSQLRFPNGNHNQMPSKAVDAMPYPIVWNDRERIALFAGYVLGVGNSMGVELVWGGDWNGNRVTTDTGFYDGPHFELVD